MPSASRNMPLGSNLVSLYGNRIRLIPKYTIHKVLRRGEVNLWPQSSAVITWYGSTSRYVWFDIGRCCILGLGVSSKKVDSPDDTKREHSGRHGEFCHLTNAKLYNGPSKVEVRRPAI